MDHCGEVLTGAVSHVTPGRVAIDADGPRWHWWKRVAHREVAVQRESVLHRVAAEQVERGDYRAVSE